MPTTERIVIEYRKDDIQVSAMKLGVCRVQGRRYRICPTKRLFRGGRPAVRADIGDPPFQDVFGEINCWESLANIDRLRRRPSQVIEVVDAIGRAEMLPIFFPPVFVVEEHSDQIGERFVSTTGLLGGISAKKNTQLARAVPIGKLNLLSK